MRGEEQAHEALHLGFRAMRMSELLDAAAWLWRRAPGPFFLLSALGVGPTLGVLLGLQYLADVRRLFATSYEYDGLVLAAALALPGTFLWRALCQGALVRLALEVLRRGALGRAEESRLPALSVRGALGEAARRGLGVCVAGLARPALVWMGPLLVLLLIATVDPEMDDILRVTMLISAGVFSLPWVMGMSALTLGMMPRAALAEPGRRGRAGAKYFARLGLGTLLHLVFVMLFFNLHLLVAVALYLSDAFFDVDVSYWGQFCSLGNTFYMMLVFGAAWLLMEPFACAASALSWVDGRVKEDALDLRGRLESLRRVWRARNEAHVAPPTDPSQRGDRRTLAERSALSLALWAALTLGGAEELRAQEGEGGEVQAGKLLHEDLVEARRLLDEETQEEWFHGEELEGFLRAQADEAQGDEARLWEGALEDLSAARLDWDGRKKHLAKLRARLQGPQLLLGTDPEGAALDPGFDPEAVERELEGILKEKSFQDLAAAEVERDNPTGLLQRRERERLQDEREALCEPRDDLGPVKPGRVDLPDLGVPPGAFKVLAVALLAVALLLLLVALVRRLGERGRSSGKAASAITAGALDAQVEGQEEALAFAPQDWRARALRLAEQGELRGAVRALYLALLVALHGQGLLRYEQARTNWEYERELAERLRARPGAEPARAAFEGLTAIFDRVWYGERPATREEFERCLAWADRVLEARPQAQEPAP
jgi:hypothetical protein